MKKRLFSVLSPNKKEPSGKSRSSDSAKEYEGQNISIIVPTRVQGPSCQTLPHQQVVKNIILINRVLINLFQLIPFNTSSGNLDMEHQKNSAICSVPPWSATSSPNRYRPQ